MQERKIPENGDYWRKCKWGAQKGKWRIVWPFWEVGLWSMAGVGRGHKSSALAVGGIGYPPHGPHFKKPNI